MTVWMLDDTECNYGSSESSSESSSKVSSDSSSELSRATKENQELKENLKAMCKELLYIHDGYALRRTEEFINIYFPALATELKID